MSVKTKLLLYIATFSILLTSFQKELFCPKANLTEQLSPEKEIKDIRKEFIKAREEYETTIKKLHNIIKFRAPEVVAMSSENLFGGQSMGSYPALNFIFHQISDAAIQRREDAKNAKIEAFFQECYKILLEKYRNIVLSHLNQFEIYANTSPEELLIKLGFTNIQIAKLTQQVTPKDMGEHFCASEVIKEIAILRVNYEVLVNQIHAEAVSIETSNQLRWHNIYSQNISVISEKKEQLYESYKNILLSIVDKYKDDGQDLISFLQESLYFTDKKVTRLLKML